MTTFFLLGQFTVLDRNRATFSPPPESRTYHFQHAAFTEKMIHQKKRRALFCTPQYIEYCSKKLMVPVSLIFTHRLSKIQSLTRMHGYLQSRDDEFIPGTSQVIASQTRSFIADVGVCAGVDLPEDLSWGPITCICC